VASDDARFAVSGVNLGLFCSTPSVALSRNLSRKAGVRDAGDRRLHQRRGGAREAAWSTAWPHPSTLDAEVERLVASIVAKPRRRPSRLGKGLFYRQLETGIAAAYDDAGQTMACNMMDESALEGVQAFIDKRKPNWA
jgi:enoyl-CoA hydratase/carnithine racemase